MKDLRQKILNIHGQIEDELDFIIDVDNSFANKFYDILDEIDSNFITIEYEEEQKIINLYQTEELGEKYLNELKELLFQIKKKGIKLNLKKLKLLLRRKKKQDELMIILNLLKKKEEFLEQNKDIYSKEEYNDLKKYIEEAKNPKIKDQKEELKINIRDNIKLTTMIGVTTLAGAIKVVIPKEVKEKIEKENKKIEKENKKIERKEKIKDTIKLTSMIGATTLAGAVKTVIPEKAKEKIEKENKKIEIEEKIKDTIKLTSMIGATTLAGAVKTVIPEEVKNKISTSVKMQEKEDSIKETIEQNEREQTLNKVTKVASTITLGATTVIAAPTIAKTVLAAEAIKTLTEPLSYQEEIDEVTQEQTQETKTENITQEGSKEKEVEEEIEEQTEILNIVQQLEEENIEGKEEEILKENGLDDKSKNEDAITKEERFEALKMSFENINKDKKEEKKLRVRKEEKKKSKPKIKKDKDKNKKEDKKIKTKEKSPFSKFINKVGRLTFMLTMNFALATVFQHQMAKSMTMSGKTKVLK